MNEFERYKRRWNLRLYGLAEKKDEDIKQKVMDICCSIIPQEKSKITQQIDIVHRLGRKSGENAAVSRTVIIQFVSRSTRDLLWKAAKECAQLKEKKLRFGEDLTTADKLRRQQLWPLVEAARQAGKKAYYIGIRAFVEGKEIQLNKD